MKIIAWAKDNYILTGLILLSFALRIYKLDFQSPWLDELFTLTNTNSGKSLSEIVSALAGDAHPPLYYFIVHFFTKIFGDSGYVARFVSVLFGVGGIVVIYYLAKELFNKSTALTAVLLLSVNHFHIYFSQEARMYTMLFFTTTLSFLFLVRFIKKPVLKSALMYSFTTALLVNTHFYSFFPLFAQYLIILYYIIKPYNTTGKKIFTYAFISGIITLVSFLPLISTLFGTSEIKSFWITLPPENVYSEMLTELIGPELCVAISLLAITYFAYTVFKEKEPVKYKIDPEKDRTVFAFHVLFIWLFISIAFPLLLSYIHIPMIVSRYFINILPAIFLLIAAGINCIESSTVKTTIISAFILFALIDLLAVKDHYNKVIKTQYREAGHFVKENHKGGEKIFSYTEPYFSYYLKEKDGHKVTQSSLGNYVGSILNNNEKPESFWYIDNINGNTSLPSKTTTAFLDSLFIVDKSVELHDVFAKHYQKRGAYKLNLDFTRFKPYKDRNGDNLNYSLDMFNDVGAMVEITGWAFFDGQSMLNAKISLVLIDGDREIELNTENVSRPDVTTYFKSNYDLSNSGFRIEINKKNLPSGNYKVALYVTDSATNKTALVINADKVISAKTILSNDK